MPKLTLSVDEKVIRDAKALAARQGTSVSALFERIIRLMTEPGQQANTAAPITRELTGIIKIPRGKGYRELVEEALVERMQR